MGTRWMCTIEAPIHHNVKEAIVKMDESGTILVLRKFRNTTRLARVRSASAAVRTKC
jgi:NAD(P)H-dependent flavin oxidoreductase YrpB (nitropropane dioxygenase family)